MKHAVILAHPKTDSFNAAIARTCVQTLERLGDTVILRDLYAASFDPRLRAEELPTAEHFAPAADTAAERLILADVDSFIFVYPFWFNAPPAILKGFVDKVFSMGFGYSPGSGGLEPLLLGKTLLSISTSGAPDHWVNLTGALATLQQAFDNHLAGVCGLKVLEHVHFGSIVPNITEEAVHDMLEEVGRRLGARFGAARAVAD